MRLQRGLPEPILDVVVCHCKAILKGVIFGTERVHASDQFFVQGSL